MNEYEEIVMQLITNSGDARSRCLKAIRAARKGNFEQADSLIEEVKKFLAIAHKTQTELIQNEIQGNHIPVSLLIIHAQDHLMNAISMRDLAIEIIEILKDKQLKG
ncbi:PTS lactose/cellobiose transporter subunit IIA [Gilliamella sp. B14384H2]|nr:MULTISPECIES: PTS lactose/cellobiose transporter subunit IIA [unclassified Gilliamella]MBI0038635.1 PTS lactose/cellobiose transporter subunit IIA [Gilliamella sp. B14384G10]MBI0040928.1 PTS lactose/cellobiose transporter subunit IIA [Gilliamella sp. B14384G7]MBI0052623.1 PTS lactose/cellobiose transporter subunit IIA [Gilliamella sp. B14384G13]MBI0054918.1 PTS lactose/cellobiose transporter subunit IIA [Gilliamella sp. B14384H2]